MDPTVANGQPAVAAYLREKPFGVALLDIRRDDIAAITVFGDPTLVESSGPDDPRPPNGPGDKTAGKTRSR
jgi:hypothetical protein